jgi:hypothetical protein
MGSLKYNFTSSRWVWLLKGLPSFPRAHALFKAKRHTMTTTKRCNNLWDVCQKVVKQKIPGAFVECGVWRGGSAVIMGLAAKRHNPVRPLHLFDSFEGLPEPGAEDGARAAEYSEGKAGGRLVGIAKCDATLEYVRMALFEQARLSPANVFFHKGWFQDTLPADAKTIGNIAVLRLDGDWYESTKICLEYLYPLLSQNGVIILDDYFCWEGCRKATDEYRNQHGITDPIVRVDQDCVLWIKS